MKNLNLFFILMLFSTSLFSQSWVGLGRGLAYAEINDDIITFSFYGYDFSRKLVCNHLNPSTKTCKVIDRDTDEPKYDIAVMVSKELDTLSIYNHSEKRFEHFIKKEKRIDNTKDLSKIKVQLQASALDDHLIEEIIIHLDGRLQINNYDNRERNEFKLSTEELHHFLNTIAYLDFYHIEEPIGYMNNCLGGNIGFVFVTKNRERFSYISEFIPDSLSELYDYVHLLKKQQLDATKGE